MRCTHRVTSPPKAHPSCRAATIVHGLPRPRLLRSGGRRGRAVIDALGRIGPTVTACAVQCQVCREGEAFEGGTCPYCGATVMSVVGRGAPLPREVMAEAEERRRTIELRREAYVRGRAKGHAIAGALIFALFGSWFAGAALSCLLAHVVTDTALSGQLAAAQGGSLPASVTTSVLLGLTLAYLLAAALGAPAGYVLSYLNRGPGFGGLVGAGAFGLCAVLVNLGSVLACASPWQLLALCAAIGAVPGGSAGYFLGWQILWDD
ncbi:MAG: hypothetical protein ACYTKD_29725 [Planctomycetota bacterium]